MSLFALCLTQKNSTRMKKALTYIFILLAAFQFTACRESLPKNFDDVSGVYFNFRVRGVAADSTAVTFVYVDEDYLDVVVPVQLLGRMSSSERPIALRIDADGSAEGVDYEVVTPAVIKPDTTALNFTLRLFRTPALQTENRLITLVLEENNHFGAPFQNTFRITYTDQFTVAPEGWMSLFVGAFSREKFELLCDIMQIKRADLSEKNLISSAKWMYIQATMLGYVADQVQLKAAGEQYDARAFDSNGNPLVFK